MKLTKAQLKELFKGHDSEIIEETYQSLYNQINNEIADINLRR